jgi:hypothetical protein
MGLFQGDASTTCLLKNSVQMSYCVFPRKGEASKKKLSISGMAYRDPRSIAIPFFHPLSQLSEHRLAVFHNSEKV